METKQKLYTGLLRELLRRKWQQAHSSEKSVQYTKKTCMQGTIRGLKVLKDTKTLNNYDLSLTLLRDNSKIGKACARCTHETFQTILELFLQLSSSLPPSYLSNQKSPRMTLVLLVCINNVFK